MLQDNVFIDVVDGMTMLIGEKFDDGLAKDLFIHDERTEESDHHDSARRAFRRA